MNYFTTLQLTTLKYLSAQHCANLCFLNKSQSNLGINKNIQVISLSSNKSQKFKEIVSIPTSCLSRGIKHTIVQFSSVADSQINYNIMHIDQTYSRTIQDIQNAVLPQHIQNPCIFRVLAFLEPEACSQPCYMQNLDIFINRGIFIILVYPELCQTSTTERFTKIVSQRL